MSDRIFRTVARYYAGKLAEHGTTARGVDWRDDESQRLRFEQLLRIAEGVHEIDVLDYGCGYGALVEHLERDGRPFTYLGYDIAPEMIRAARKVFERAGSVRLTDDPDALEPRAFAVASGVLNVRLETPETEWHEHVLATIDRLNALSRCGFAFNALTSYSEAEKMRPDLYYADPRELFDVCERRYSRNVALLHDYGLWEFTVLVRKDV